MQEAMTVHYSECAGENPAYPLMIEGFNYLVQEELTPPRGALFKDDDGIIYAEKGNEYLGCIVFRQEGSVVNIILAYVEPSSRKQGVFRDLLQNLARLTRKRKASRIHFVVPTGNDIAHDVMERVGNVYQDAIRYEMEI